MLAVYAFHSRSITYREQHSFLILTPDTTFHFHYKHTPQNRTALGKYSFPFRRLHTFRFPTSYFLTHFQWCFLFSAKCLPQKQPQCFPHRPVVVAVRQATELIFMCLRSVYSFRLHPLRELSSFLTPNPYTTFCLHLSIHLSTARHKYSFSHSIYSVPTVIHMPFSNPFPAVAFLPAASSPQKNRNLFFLINLI